MIDDEKKGTSRTEDGTWNVWNYLFIPISSFALNEIQVQQLAVFLTCQSLSWLVGFNLPLARYWCPFSMQNPDSVQRARRCKYKINILGTATLGLVTSVQVIFNPATSHHTQARLINNPQISMATVYSTQFTWQVKLQTAFTNHWPYLYLLTYRLPHSDPEFSNKAHKNRSRILMWIRMQYTYNISK